MRPLLDEIFYNEGSELNSKVSDISEAYERNDQFKRTGGIIATRLRTLKTQDGIILKSLLLVEIDETSMLYILDPLIQK